MASVADQPPPAGAHSSHTRRALTRARSQLEKRALKLLGYLVFAYLVLKVLPALKQAVHSLERVRWEWVVATVALMILS